MNLGNEIRENIFQNKTKENIVRIETTNLIINFNIRNWMPKIDFCCTVCLSRVSYRIFSKFPCLTDFLFLLSYKSSVLESQTVSERERERLTETDGDRQSQTETETETKRLKGRERERETENIKKKQTFVIEEQRKSQWEILTQLMS